MSVNAIYITNLPWGITERQLKEQLCGNVHVSKYFKTPNDEGVLTVKMYGKGAAVVSGISCDFDKLSLAFRKVGLWSNATKGELRDKIVIKPDTGEVREVNGKFKQNRPSHFRVELDKFRGVIGRKTLDIFNEDLLDSIPDMLFDGFRTAAYIHSETFHELDEDVFETAGYVGNVGIHYVGDPPRPRGKFMTFFSKIELLQAYAMFNKNPKLAKAPPFFTDNEGKKEVKCNYQRGLGVDRQPLNIEELVKDKGYVPLEKFHEDFLNRKNIRRIKATCIKCNTQFKILGVNIDLNYLTGTCECSYDGSLWINDKNRAFFWEGEQFTRLVPTVAYKKRARNIETINYDVLLEPCRREYQSTYEYVNVMCPLLFHENHFSINDLAKYTQQGTLKESKHVEPLSKEQKSSTKDRKEKDDDVQKPDGLYSIIFQTPISAAWVKNNPKAISKVEIQPKFKQDGKKIEPFTAIVCRIESLDNGNAKVYCQAKLLKEYWAENLPDETNIQVTPIPCSTEYDATRKLLESLKTGNHKPKTTLQKVMLGKRLSLENWNVNPSSITLKEEWTQCATKNLFRNLLNTQQLKALDTAESKKFSIIHGFPGSGKTYAISVIVLHLLLKEKGHILLCAPSNHACNQLGEKIAKIAKGLGLEAPGILRILAQGKDATGYKERGMSVLRTELEENPNTKWLNRDEIYTIEEATNLSPNCIAEIIQHSKDNRLDLLTARQLSVLDQHRRKVEEEIMDGFPIIICTVGSLSDNRVKQWAQNDNKISSIVLDEAGQCQHPTTLLLSGFNATRIILAGDPLQLRPSVHSMPAQLGLLDVSLIDAASFQALVTCGKNNIPWNQLTIEYRMHPTIYELVCRVTYTGLIPETKITFEEACQKSAIKPWMNNLLKKYNRKRIIVFKHFGKDESDGTSYRNKTEARLIVEKVEEFLKKGIQQSQISVITMYDAQKDAISDSLGKIGIYDVEVSNVDAVQGKENDIVILSLVRSNKDSDIGFLCKVNRLNVAISRAKEFLVIPCNLEFFKKVEIQHWKTFVKLIVGDRKNPSQNIAIVV